MGVSLGLLLGNNSSAHIKTSGRRPNAKAVVSAMPVVMAKARVRIAAIVMAITPLQRCLGLGASLWGCRSIKNKQTIAIAVKYPMRSHRYLHSATWNNAAGTGEKLCPASQQR